MVDMGVAHDDGIDAGRIDVRLPQCRLQLAGGIAEQ
jgi:hypothetical protein